MNQVQNQKLVCEVDHGKFQITTKSKYPLTDSIYIYIHTYILKYIHTYIYMSLKIWITKDCILQQLQKII